MASEVSFSSDDDGRVRVDGRLTFETVDTRLLERSRGIVQGKGDLVVDLSRVDDGDSAGLALMIEWCCWAKQAGSRLDFEHVPSSLLGIAGISDVAGILGLTAEDKIDGAALSANE